MIDEAKSAAFSAEKCTINRDEALDILDEMRSKLPLELKKARAEAIAVSGEMQSTPITTNTLTGTYPEHASSLFNQVKQCEDEINTVQDKDE